MDGGGEIDPAVADKLYRKIHNSSYISSHSSRSPVEYELTETTDELTTTRVCWGMYLLLKFG